MEIPIYLSFEEFQSQFKIDFVQISSDNTNTSLIEYYKDLKTRYENVLHNCKNAKKDLQYLKEKIVIRKKNQLSGKTFDLNSEKLSIEIQQFNDTYKLPIEMTILGIGIDKLENFLKQTIQEINKIIALLIFEITKQPKQLNSNRTDLSAPEKIAVLYEIGIQETLNKIPVQEDKYRFIHSLIGGSYDNVKKYMVNGLSKDNKLKAKDFINSKTI